MGVVGGLPKEPDRVGVLAVKGVVLVAVVVGGPAAKAAAALFTGGGGAWSNMEETGWMGAGGALGGSGAVVSGLGCGGGAGCC